MKKALSVLGLIVVIVSIFMSMGNPSHKKVANDSRDTVLKVLNEFYRDGSVQINSYTLDDQYSGTVNYSWNGKSMSRRVKITITKNNMTSYEYSAVVMLADYEENPQHLNEDAKMWFRMVQKDNRSVLGNARLLNSRITRDPLQLHCETNEGNVVLTFKKGADGGWGYSGEME